MEQALEKLARRIQKENRVVAFTGSGISAESGIPTFRGEGGIWKKYRPSLYGNIPGLFLAYLLSPSRIHAFSLEAFSTFLTAEPNPAHKVLLRHTRYGDTPPEARWRMPEPAI